MNGFSTRGQVIYFVFVFEDGGRYDTHTQLNDRAGRVFNNVILK